MSKASREVANISEIKNLHTPVYGVKESVCQMSVCLSVTNSDPNYVRTGRTEWADFFKDIYASLVTRPVFVHPIYHVCHKN